jgi:hypothetical protein
VVLDDDPLSGLRRDVGVNLAALGARHEERRVRGLEEMLNVKQRFAARPEDVKQRASPAARVLGPDKLHPAAWEVVVLNVDDDQRASHTISSPDNDSVGAVSTAGRRTLHPKSAARVDALSPKASTSTTA